MKIRRGGSRNAIPPSENGSGSRQLRSCLKVGPDSEEKSFVPPSHGAQDSSSSTRDQSTKSSGRSILSIISASGSSRSRDTPMSEEHPRTASGDSVASTTNSIDRSSNHSPIVSRVPVEAKAVRFGNILIREHERAVGDNPSCSTGPPIGIGWRHGDTTEICLDDYEEKRRERRQLIVLTRAEREELLLNWGIAFEDIIDSIRANIRVKNQRRQTVTNLGKVERLEEAFESATRKIKRALLLRRRTGEKGKQWQEQIHVAGKIVSSPMSSVSDEQRESTIPNLENNTEMGKKPEEHCEPILHSERRHSQTTESGARLVRTVSSMSDIDDLHTSTSGFSFDNSTTASAREVERFYRELELEMFGDLPLPDMVGETLEVPGLSIPEEDRVYFDPQILVGCNEETPSVAPSYARMMDESKEYHESDLSLGTSNIIRQNEMRMYFQPYETTGESKDWNDYNGKPVRSMLSHILQQAADEYDTFDHTQDSRQDTRVLRMQAPEQDYIFYHDPVMDIRMGQALPPYFKLSTSLDSTDLKQVELHRANIARQYLSQTVTAMEQRYLHPSLAPPIPLTSHFGINFYPEDRNWGIPRNELSAPPCVARPESPVSSERSQKSGTRSRRSRRRDDEPVVCYIPPYTHRSTAYWMEAAEDEEGPCIPINDFEIITIHEDAACDDRIRPAVPDALPATSTRPTMYFSPPRFPDALISG